MVFLTDEITNCYICKAQHSGGPRAVGRGDGSKGTMLEGLVNSHRDGMHILTSETTLLYSIHVIRPHSYIDSHMTIANVPK